MRDLLKPFLSPVIVSAFLMFGVAFNFIMQDLGETYVSRNMFGWVVVFLSVVHLWWRPLTRGTINWSPIWLIGLLVPVAGFVVLLAINIVFGFEHYHPGHNLFPFMLLAFALLIGGLLQYEWDETIKFNFMLVALICFMPQYFIHLITGNAVIFALLPVDEISIYTWLYKPFAGFGQYNIYGSAYATMIVMSCAAYVFAPVSQKARLVFMIPVALLAIDLPFTKSSTALLGLFSGMAFLAVHIHLTTRQPLQIKRYWTFVGVLAVISLLVVTALAFTEQTDKINELSARRTTYSFNTRWTMWVLGFWGFVEKPLFGAGLGSYLSVYMAQFAEFGIDQGLTFFPNVTVPHNLVIHVLAETGLVGFAVLLGPFIYLAVKILQTVDNRFLVLALLAPILVHTQLEYPYIASGTHYWLVAIALVFGLGGQLMPDREFKIPAVRLPIGHLGFGALSLVAAIGIYTAVQLALMANISAQLYTETRKLSLDEFIQIRFNMVDAQHPIFGKRVRAIAHLVIIQKAVTDRRADVLRDISVPALEKDILPYYPTVRTWENALRVYLILRDRDRAMALIAFLEKVIPEKAAGYKSFVRQNLPVTPPSGAN